jgi:hypothetical protein
MVGGSSVDTVEGQVRTPVRANVKSRLNWYVDRSLVSGSVSRDPDETHADQHGKHADPRVSAEQDHCRYDRYYDYSGMARCDYCAPHSWPSTNAQHDGAHMTAQRRCSCPDWRGVLLEARHDQSLADADRRRSASFTSIRRWTRRGGVVIYRGASHPATADALRQQNSQSTIALVRPGEKGHAEMPCQRN